MQKRGGGRFGKYGDLKRKEKIRQTRVLKRDDKAKAKARQSVTGGWQHEQPRKLSTDGAATEQSRPNRKPNGEADNS